MTNQIKTNLIVLQSTPFCNISCKYCYLPERHRKSKQDLDKFHRILSNIQSNFNFEEKITLLWHSGEPLTLGPKYYEGAMEIADKVFADNELSFEFQTNGTLLNPSWKSIYSSPRVKFGVSLDGNEKMHDAKRMYRHGAGTFNKVMDAINLLEKESVPYSVICVLNQDYLDKPDWYEDFFSQLGASTVTFLNPTNEGIGTHGLINNDTTKERLIGFYRYFVRKKLLGKSKFEINPIDEMVKRVTSPKLEAFSHDEQHAYRILTVGVDGKISTFSPELAGFSHKEHGSFYIGNADDCFEIDCNKLSKFQSEIYSGIKRCIQECEYYEVCGGGLPTNKFFDTGRFDSTKHTNCILGQILLADVVAEEYLKLATV